MRESEGTDEIVSAVAVVAEMLRGLQAGGAMFLEKTQEVFALDEVNLAGLDRFGRKFVIDARDAGVKSEDLAGFGDLKDERFAFCGVDRELHAALAKHVDSAGRLAFHK